MALCYIWKKDVTDVQVSNNWDLIMSIIQLHRVLAGHTTLHTAVKYTSCWEVVNKVYGFVKIIKLLTLHLGCPHCYILTQTTVAKIELSQIFELQSHPVCIKSDNNINNNIKSAILTVLNSLPLFLGK